MEKIHRSVSARTVDQMKDSPIVRGRRKSRKTMSNRYERLR